MTLAPKRQKSGVMPQSTRSSPRVKPPVPPGFPPWAHPSGGWCKKSKAKPTTSVYRSRSETAGTCTMALRGRRHWLAIDGLGGPSYKTSDCDRLRYNAGHHQAALESFLAVNDHLLAGKTPPGKPGLGDRQRCAESIPDRQEALGRYCGIVPANVRRISRNLQEDTVPTTFRTPSVLAGAPPVTPIDSRIPRPDRSFVVRPPRSWRQNSPASR